MTHENNRLEITIHTDTNDRKLVLANRIHKSLVGTPDYIENRIVLNMDNDCEIVIIVGKDAATSVLSLMID